MESEKRVALSLLLLRVGVFIVMFVWTLDKFVHPEHAAKVYGKFYLIQGLDPSIFSVIGAVELVIIVGFLIGFQKKWTYGIVLVLHAVSTLSAYQLYFSPFQNLLFFAAWPMLAACFALFYLRDMDRMWVVQKT